MANVLKMYSRSFIILLLLIFNMATYAQDLKLFSPEQRKTASKTHVIVMDFLERYFSELPHLKHTTIATKLADDKVFFRNGSMSDLTQVTDTMPFTINFFEKYYEVEWKKQEKPFVTIVFPAQYDLLLGMQQDEAQRKIKELITTTPHLTIPISIPEGIRKIENGIYMAKTGFLELESFNDATYYNKVENNFHPYYDRKHLDYSAANLFHGLVSKSDYKMYVEQSVYGLQTINYTISLRQWLDYCASLGLKVFFGVEEQRKDGILALVIAQSKELGFNHMLSVVIPDKFVTDKNTVLKVRMTPYIPIHNIKNLFQTESVNRRKKNWQ